MSSDVKKQLLFTKSRCIVITIDKRKKTIINVKQNWIVFSFSDGVRVIEKKILHQVMLDDET